MTGFCTFRFFHSHATTRRELEIPTDGSQLKNRAREYISQPTHRKRMKTLENKGFLNITLAVGQGVAVKPPAQFEIANKINGFVHDSYGTAMTTLLYFFCPSRYHVVPIVSRAKS